MPICALIRVWQGPSTRQLAFLLAAQITAKVLSRAAVFAPPQLQCLRLCVVSEFLRDQHAGALAAAGEQVFQPRRCSVEWLCCPVWIS
jgi:hypothetical protein